MTGKNKCKILKDIRREIAKQNDIDLVIEECKFKGDCLGTCPKCEAEVRYLERELEKRRSLGKTVAIAGLVATLTASMASCDLPDRQNKTLKGSVPYVESTEDAVELAGIPPHTEPESTEDQILMGKFPLPGEPPTSEEITAETDNSTLEEEVVLQGDIAFPEYDIDQVPETTGPTEDDRQ